MTQAVRENEISFAKLIIIWHLVFMLSKVGEYSKFTKNERHKIAIFVIAGSIGIPSIIILLFTPLFAWFNYEFTQMDTSYWTLRYLMLFFYIVFNTLTSIFPHVYNFLFFISDGIILGQLTSLYLFNEFSMSVMLSTLPVLFVLHNHMLVKGI